MLSTALEESDPPVNLLDCHQAVRKLVDQFIAELKAGVPAKEKGGATPADGAADASSGGAQAANKTQAAAAKVAAPKAAAAIRGSNQGGKVASSRARLELEKQFYCRWARYEWFGKLPAR